MSIRSRLSLAGLVTLVGGSGVLHIVAPAAYRSIVPHPLRGQAAAIVGLSGAFELICAALLLSRRTRPLGAWATAALLVAVLPANLQMALDGGHSGLPSPLDGAAAAWLRVPLQLPLIAWALSFRTPPHGVAPDPATPRAHRP